MSSSTPCQSLTESHFVSCAPSEPAGSSAKEMVRIEGFSVELDVNRGLAIVESNC